MTGQTEQGTKPHRFAVSVLMERRKVEGNPWIAESWRAVGVTVGAAAATASDGERPSCVVSGSGAAQYLWTGLTVELPQQQDHALPAG